MLASGLVSEVSTTTLWRWLAEDPIKPWQHHSWIFPRDPEFAAKAGVVLDAPLGAGQYVISADEKTSIQARRRRHTSLPAGRARSMRVEHEYERGGALASLAAWDVHHT
ncbi:MAG TPA: IS630 family transposase, partial [Actinomycetes bacterium]|nr:IS630 family transposase [Actinomycetes bacterium]